MTMNNKMNVREAVAERLAASSNIVAERVITALLEETLSKRVSQISECLTLQDKINKELKKLTPDNITYQADGTVLYSGYTKQRLEDINKTKKKLDTITKAIDDALVGNFDKITNVISGKD